MKIRAIITGASGMVGEGVMHECLQHPDVEKVLVLGRKHCGTVHSKLTELIHPELYNLSGLEERLAGYNACYFCLGTTSVGKNEEEFTRITYTLTMHVARMLSKLNPDMTFCYVSGSGTNPNGSQMWQRVKGKTENDLTKLPFKQVFNFRPGFMQPTEGLKNAISAYTYFSWMFPILKVLFPGVTCRLSEVGQAMINVTQRGYNRNIIEVKDMVAASKK